MTKEAALKPLADVYESYRDGRLKFAQGAQMHRLVLIEDEKGNVLLTMRDAFNAYEATRRR